MYDSIRGSMRDALGPMVEPPNPNLEGDEFAVLRVIVPAGIVVPLHSHADRECIVVMEGQLSAWLGDGWKRFDAGDKISIDPHVKHSLRNENSADVALVLVTTARMGQFFGELIAKEDQAKPTPERIQAMMARSEAYGYWNGTPDDQAKIGVPSWASSVGKTTGQ